jgi:hypothetical protein
MEKRLEFKQDLIFFAVPLTFDLLFLAGALFLSFPFNLILGLVAVIFAGVVVWQSRPFLKNYQLILTPKFLEVRDIRKNTVRKIDWNKVEAAAAGYKKSWLLYTYSFYFRVKGDEDLLLSLIHISEPTRPY